MKLHEYRYLMMLIIVSGSKIMVCRFGMSYNNPEMKSDKIVDINRN